MTRPKTLSCGGKGPCCHIGYSHRHCEHCDVVIDTRPANWWYAPYFVQPTTIRPYQPNWGAFQHGTYNNFGDVGNAINQRSQGLLSALNATAADASYNVQSLPEPTAAHVCEVK